MSNSFIWPLHMTLSGATIPCQSGPGCNGNKEVLHINQSSSITRVSPSDCFMSYPGHSLEEPYSSAEMQSVYSTTPAKWANKDLRVQRTLKETWQFYTISKMDHIINHFKKWFFIQLILTQLYRYNYSYLICKYSYLIQIIFKQIYLNYR